MMSLARLCHRLRVGSCTSEDVRTAEAWVETGIEKGTAGGRRLPLLGDVWQAGFGELFGAPSENALAILACAPLLQLEGVWLSRMGQPSVSHLPAQNRLFRIHGDLMGLDDPATSPALRHRAELMGHGISLPASDGPDYFEDRRLSRAALDFSVLSLGLSHRSRRFFPEILGFTLAWLCEDRPGGVPAGLEAQRIRHRDIVRTLVEEHSQFHSRMEAGWALHVTAVMAVADEISKRPFAESGPHAAMIELIQARLPHALGYHSKVLLKGRPLDEWLQASAHDPDALLKALHESGFVDRSCPASSRLLKAIEFGGPMLGVFSERDAALIRRWIASPHQRSLSAVSGTAPASAEQVPPPTLESTQAIPISTRSLYHALLQAESPADVYDIASRQVSRILQFTRCFQLLRVRKGLSFDYSPQALNDFIESFHAHEVSRHAARRGTRRIDKAFLHWFLVQLAPAILVDGAWLAESSTVTESLDPHTRCLLKIQLDEAGDGHVEWNHPNVYRRLLDGLNPDLPDFEQIEFADSPRFIDAAFDVPAYLLAMGLTANAHLPERLGLNLAIELSGLGADYLNAIQILREHQLDPTIICLHLSIDNTANGHSALAAKALNDYLSRVGQLEGPEAVRAVWKRVGLGYDSLKTVGLRFAFHMIGRYWADHLATTKSAVH